MNEAVTVALTSSSPTLTEPLNLLSAQLSLPVHKQGHDEADYYLLLETHPTPPGYRCLLQKTGSKAPGPVMVDFTAGQAAHRRQFGGGRKQTLARAVGIRSGFNPVILDVTGGLGKDAFVLASLGCTITILERKAVIYALLKNGIERAQYHDNTKAIANRLELIHTDAVEYLSRLQSDQQPDVIYLDPMYPSRDKSALVKKEMQYFHDIAGRDDDAGELLLQALSSGVRRVVVKRPAKAKTLTDKIPDTVVSSKNTRYDIYLNH